VNRLVLVRVPVDEPDPPGTYVHVTFTDPRRYAVVDDVVAFTIWVARRLPLALIPSGDGVAVQRDTERRVCRVVVERGGWVPDDRFIGPGEPVPGVVVRDDGQIRIVGTPLDGSVLESWVSPGDIEVADGHLADRVERVQSGRYRRG
jgi:hypothetical protein